MGPGFSFKCHFNLKSHSFQLIVLKIKDLKGITDLKGLSRIVQLGEVFIHMYKMLEKNNIIQELKGGMGVAKNNISVSL